MPKPTPLKFDLTLEELNTTLKLLARVDALFTPLRCNRTQAAGLLAAVIERRKQYARYGLQLTISGSAAARMAVSRLCTRLGAIGLLQSSVHEGKRFARFTAAGENHMRSLAPTNRVDESWPLVALVKTAARRFGSNAGFAYECDILAVSGITKPTADDLQKLEDEALPLLVAGVLDSASDTEGRIGYQVQSKDPPRPPAMENPPKYVKAHADQFIDEYLAALAERESWEPSTQRLIGIPLSAGRWGERASRTT